jgi:hypothetical protein
MKDQDTSREILKESEQPRLSYHAPELINLGQIQSIVRHGGSHGSDGFSPISSAS